MVNCMFWKKWTLLLTIMSVKWDELLNRLHMHFNVDFIVLFFFSFTDFGSSQTSTMGDCASLCIPCRQMARVYYGCDDLKLSFFSQWLEIMFWFWIFRFCCWRWHWIVHKEKSSKRHYRTTHSGWNCNCGRKITQFKYRSSWFGCEQHFNWQRWPSYVGWFWIFKALTHRWWQIGLDICLSVEPKAIHRSHWRWTRIKFDGIVENYAR